MTMLSHALRFWTLIAGFLVSLGALAGEADRRAAQILHYATASNQPAIARQLADLYYRAFPDPDRQVFALLYAALETDRWQQAVPRAKASVAAFGVPFTLETEGGPLAPLARSLVNGIEIGTVERQAAIAGALAKIFPDQPFFSYAAQGLQRAKHNADRHAQTALRGQHLIDTAREALARMDREDVVVTPSGKEIPVQRSAAEQANRRADRATLQRRLAEGEQLVKQGQAYQPLDVALRELTRLLHQSIDELETIGEL